GLVAHEEWILRVLADRGDLDHAAIAAADVLQIDALMFLSAPDLVRRRVRARDARTATAIHRIGESQRIHIHTQRSLGRRSDAAAVRTSVAERQRRRA